MREGRGGEGRRGCNVDTGQTVYRFQDDLVERHHFWRGVLHEDFEVHIGTLDGIEHRVGGGRGMYTRFDSQGRVDLWHQLAEVAATLPLARCRHTAMERYAHET